MALSHFIDHEGWLKLTPKQQARYEAFDFNGKKMYALK